MLWADSNATAVEYLLWPNSPELPHSLSLLLKKASFLFVFLYPSAKPSSYRTGNWINSFCIKAAVQVPSLHLGSALTWRLGLPPPGTATSITSNYSQKWLWELWGSPAGFAFYLPFTASLSLTFFVFSLTKPDRSPSLPSPSFISLAIEPHTQVLESVWLRFEFWSFMTI